MKKRIAYILGVLVLLGIDWFTKYLAQAHLGERSIPVIGEFLQLRYVLNTGVSFSMFAGNKVVTLLMPVLAMIIFVAMYFYFRYYFQKRNEQNMIKVLNLISMPLLIGFVGNYTGRIVHGGVIDFISVKGFAVFNFADIYITVSEFSFFGMACYQCWKESKEKKEKKAEGDK